MEKSEAALKLTLIGVCDHDNRLCERLQVICIAVYFYGSTCDLEPLVEPVVLTAGTNQDWPQNYFCLDC